MQNQGKEILNHHDYVITYAVGWSVFDRSLACLRSAKRVCSIIRSSYGTTSFSSSASANENRSLQWNRATHLVCSRTSLHTALYFWTRTQSDCFAWRPLKANSDSVSFFVSALDAAMSSIRYNVGVSAATPKRARSQSCSFSPGSIKRKQEAWGPRHSHGRSR